jgi:DNA-binding transcriptional regulator YhcF (GntR family)
MNSANIFSYISIDAYSATPKYAQLSNSIVKAIERELIGKDYLLPSINQLSYELDVSRDIVEKAYRHLKKLGVIVSVPGKGYFVSSINKIHSLKIFLLFNKLSIHKKIMYDAFVASMGNDAIIDFYIYNNDYALFKKLLSNRMYDYSNYVIIPHFLEGGENAAEIINSIPKKKLLLLDHLLGGVNGQFSAVYQDFEKDIYVVLVQMIDKLSKYKTIKIVLPDYTYHPRQILQGLHRFSIEYAFHYEVVTDVRKAEISVGEVYIILMEDDLVTLIEKVIETKLVVGSQVGIIAYNETPIKKLIHNGITTISTDFHLMGKKAAQLVMSNSQEQIAIPFRVTFRASL